MNEKFKNAIQNKLQKTPPIWFMRQAGRYHSHYQGLRKKNSFMDLCKLPDLAAEVAMGPIMDFDFDVAILFSDLLFPLQALGLGLDYTDEGPKLEKHLTPERMGSLTPFQEAWPMLLFQKKALELTRKRLPEDKSLIGFVGGPWTLFVYAVEGSHKGSLTLSKKYLPIYQDFCQQHLLPLLRKNIELQLEGGAEVVMVFDTAAGELDPLTYQKYVAPQLIALSKEFPGKLGYYSKTTMGSYFSKEFFECPWAGLGFDHRWNLPGLIRNLNSSYKNSFFIQGNFDQSLLHQEPEDFSKSMRSYLQSFKEIPETERARWVCGLGHGVLPHTPEKNVHKFIELVRKEFFV
ncbi:MAG: uroporphyrinogen decarboxylase [Bdellovibrionaceae bacterium]|nr:uroporphyrinogen decarboxylase [Pseudobdellovibrionaceae bacterium]